MNIFNLTWMQWVAAFGFAGTAIWDLFTNNMMGALIKLAALFALLGVGQQIERNHRLMMNKRK